MTYQVELRFQVDTKATQEAVEDFVRLFYIKNLLSSVIPRMAADKFFMSVEGVEDATD